MEYIGNGGLAAVKKVNPAAPGHAPVKEICAGCKKMIEDKYLLRAENKYWHEDCLKCSCCECRLGEVGSSFFLKANLFLCRRDYLRLFGNTGYCTACEKVIPAFEMVMKARANVYHLECFACQECNHRFCVGDKFYLWQNRILCERDYRTYAFGSNNTAHSNLILGPGGIGSKQEPFQNQDSILVPDNNEQKRDEPSFKSINQSHQYNNHHTRTIEDYGQHSKRANLNPQRAYHDNAAYSNNDFSTSPHGPPLQYDLIRGDREQTHLQDDEDDDSSRDNVDLYELLADPTGHSNMAPELTGNVTT